MSPRWSLTSRMIRHARQAASVYIITQVARVCVEALLAHHLLAVHGPAFDELRRVDERPDEARMLDRVDELLVVARIGLVDARVVERRVVVLAQRARLAVD